MSITGLDFDPRKVAPPAAFPRYRFAGSHRTIGRQFGEACAELVRRHRDLALARLERRTGIPSDQALSAALAFRPAVLSHAPSFDEEIQGVAEGAGLSLSEAYVLQLRAELAELSRHGLDIRVIGDEMGQASGLKMCYGALTKGLQALGVELLMAARLMGLEEVLRAEQRESIPDVLAWLERGVPTMPPKAYRWVGEMEEIASCFADLGLTPRILAGAADLYRLVADTPIPQPDPDLSLLRERMEEVAQICRLRPRRA